MYTVYMHTCPNGKRYVGMTKQENVNERWRYGHGYKHCTDFNNAIIEFGWRNIAHEVLARGLSKEEAERMERETIELYKTNEPEYGYNSHSGGLSEAKVNYVTRSRMSKAQNGSGNPMYGRSQSAETKEKIASTKRGKPLSKECKDKLSEALGGANNPAARAVVQYDLSMNVVKVWPYARAARRATGANNISECCRGKLRTSGGYIWRYANEVGGA